MEYGFLFAIIACAFGLWMAWGVGANDLANIMSTTMGSKAVTVKQALAIAIIFEVAGALLGGNEVSTTVRTGIINFSILQHTPQLFVYGMLSVLFASAIWITVASYLGMPVSITNAIVGGLVGVGAVMLGVHAVHWPTVGYIAISWIASPTIAGIVSYLLFISIKRSILGSFNPLRAAQRYIPVYLFSVCLILALMTVLRGLDHFHVVLPPAESFLVVIAVALSILGLSVLAIFRIRIDSRLNRHTQFHYIESMFSILTALTACAMVFAHGSNDIAVAVGPVAAIVTLVWQEQFNHHPNLLLSVIMLAGCGGVLLGLIMYGRKVIQTVGSGITALTPSRAFAATLAAATTVAVSTSMGIPVSATQTLVGAVFGVGLARGIDALNLAVIRNIFMSWVITIPAAAGIAMLFFLILRSIFG